jgi:2-iminoacetate synthase
MPDDLPSWLDPGTCRDLVDTTSPERVEAALASTGPDLRDLAALLSPTAVPHIEAMAQRAQQLTRRHFGRTVSLYVPLYLSNHCPGGCAYCGFASDREQGRQRLEPEGLDAELAALKAQGFDDVLLLTGERCPEADVDYLVTCVETAAQRFHKVSIESFAMTTGEYKHLVDAGCTGITLYQETYDPGLYEQLHRWGPKRDYRIRLEAPGQALDAGMRSAGLGALLGLGDPIFEMLCCYNHARHLLKHHYRSGVMISFPRIRPQVGSFTPSHAVTPQLLAQIIFAMRICLPDVPLVLSTREAATFRDGMAGIGISRMSVASRTTVGGYANVPEVDGRQFDVADGRDVETFCRDLEQVGLEPVFKNWDAVFQAL